MSITDGRSANGDIEAEYDLFTRRKLAPTAQPEFSDRENFADRERKPKASPQAPR